MDSIYLGNHFCIDDDIFKDLIILKKKLCLTDIFILRKPIAIHKNSDSILCIEKFMDHYELKYKFASSFDTSIRATQFENENIRIYRDIHIDVILYTIKLLEDQNESVSIQDISLSDENVLELLKTKSDIVKIYFDNKIDFTSFDELYSLFVEVNKPGLAYIAYWSTFLWLYYPKEYWAAKFYLYSCQSQSMKAIISEVSDLLDTGINYNEYFYPGMFVTRKPRRHS